MAVERTEFDLFKKDIAFFLPHPQRQLLKQLAELYEEVDRRLKAFASQTGIACLEGCGSCCEHFEPEILPVEALALANYLYRYGQLSGWEKLTLSRPEGSCPFYCAGSPTHCSVYPARPLVCRLFGFSGIYDKYGRVSYVSCKKMPLRLKAVFHKDDPLCPPVMAEFGLPLKALQPTADFKPLRKAVSQALVRLFWQSSFHPQDLGQAG